MTRRALLIGIDAYPRFGPEVQLAGAGNDVEAMATWLARRNFDDLTFLCDAEATRAGILEAMDGVLSRTRGGDIVWFLFSGHGSQVTDREGDEGDGLDETIVPWDSGREPAANQDITDDEVNSWAAALLAITPHVVLIFDCCHSATLHRPGWRTRAVPVDRRPGSYLPPAHWWARDREIGTGRRPIAIGACGDQESAHELPPWIAGVDRGALSFHLVAALEMAVADTTWRQVFGRARVGWRRDVPEQEPTLAGDGIDQPIFFHEPSRRSADGPALVALGTPSTKGLAVRYLCSRHGPWRAVDEPLELSVGDRLRIDLRLDPVEHPRGRWLYVFDVGSGGTIETLFPGPDDHERLDPGRTLVVGARPGDRLGVIEPSDAPTDRREWIAHLVIVLAGRRFHLDQWVAGDGGPVDGMVVAVPYRLYRE